MCRNFDWTHMATIFIRIPGTAVYNLYTPIIQSNKYRKQEPSTRIILSKNMCEHTLTNSLWLENLWRKNRRLNKDERDQNLAFNLVILVRIPPNFLSKSRVLHLVCTPTGYIQERGAPVVLTFCFSKLYLCRQLWMEMEIMLVFYSGILFQKVYWSATLSQERKNLVGSLKI